MRLAEGLIEIPLHGLIYSIAAMSKKDFSSAFNMSYVGIGVLNGLLREFSSKDKQLEKTICDAIGPFPVVIY